MQMSHSKRVTFVEPGWKIEFPDNNKSPKHKQGMLARPFIAEMFPGYSGYFYADADVWFADPSAVIDYIKAARATGASFGIEAHPTYKIHQTLRSIHFKQWSLIYGYKSHLFSNVLKMFGPDIAIKMANHSLLNSSIFYMDANSPIWDAWIQYYRRAKVTLNNISNQACLHVAIVQEALPFAAMPATHNWLPAKSPPAIDLKSLSLVEPCFPNAPIKAIHLTDKSERREFELMTIDGGERVRTHPVFVKQVVR
jgi:hypothetical protein